MSCVCVPTANFQPSCLRKPAGGFRTTVYYVPVCELPETPFTFDYTGTIVTGFDPGVAFRTIKTMKDGITFNATHEAGPARTVQSVTLNLDLYSDASTSYEALAEAYQFLNGFFGSTEEFVLLLVNKEGVGQIVGLTNGLSLADGPGVAWGQASGDIPMATITFSEPQGQLPYILETGVAIPTA